MALSDKWYQLMTPSLALSQVEAQQMQSLSSGSCKSQQETLQDFHRPWESMWPSAQEGHLVGTEETWCGWVDSAPDTGSVFQCQEPCPCWWGEQWRVWSEGWCSPRLCAQPTAFHHCAGSLVTCVPLRGPMGGPLCWRPCYHSWITGGMSEGSWHGKKQWRRKGWE